MQKHAQDEAELWVWAEIQLALPFPSSHIKQFPFSVSCPVISSFIPIPSQTWMPIPIASRHIPNGIDEHNEVVFLTETMSLKPWFHVKIKLF